MTPLSTYDDVARFAAITEEEFVEGRARIEHDRESRLSRTGQPPDEDPGRDA